MIDKISNLPNRSQTNEEFTQNADNAWPQLNRFAEQANALGDDVSAKQIASAASASGAAASATAAATSETNAAAAASAAAQLAGATKWVAGTNYADGKAVWSPSSYLTYRKQGEGISNVDPGVNISGWIASSPSGGGAGGEVITGDITLTAGSPAAIVVAPTRHGHYMTLADATTLQEGITQQAVYNSSDFAYGVKNKTGTILGWVPARKGVSLLLADNTTVAGVWGGVGLDKIAVTSEYSPLTQTGYGTIHTRVTLDSNRELFLTNDWAFVYDASDNTYGDMYYTGMLSPFVTGQKTAAILASNDLVLVVFEQGDNPAKIRSWTLSISGKVITVNSSGTPIYTGTYSCESVSNIVALSGGFVVGWIEGASEAWAMGITISGTTPSHGAARLITNTSGEASTSNQVLLVTGSNLRAVSIGATGLCCRPATLSGNTLTMGTKATAPTGGQSLFKVVVNGNGNVLVHYKGNTGSANSAALFKLTGTVEAVSTINFNEQVLNGNNNGACLIPISASKTFIAYITGSVNSYANILTDTSGTLSQTQIGYTLDSGALGYCVALASSGNAANYVVSKSGITWNISVDCSGATPVLSSIRKQVFPTSFGISYPNAGQDKFSNLAPSHLRTTTKDFFPRENYLGSLVVGKLDNSTQYSVNETGLVLGKTDSVRWLFRNVTNTNGIQVRKIEVAE